ncbi:uncharacterized protein PSFLO_00974 [Pseudozyma flocculosa]|uniref:Uncharacterized protein n=1 Tax=Pseudozyma flocculosa TaxID=84751 RepID=A0A5C3ET23_9BASI|nr:uncharacterized protein PSFLO_00974 [Pseudozyma flocculosa]
MPGSEAAVIWKAFFKELWLALTTRRRVIRERHGRAQCAKDLAVLDRHVGPYLALTGLQRVRFDANPGSIADYISTEMLIAYITNIKNHFGSHIKKLIKSKIDLTAFEEGEHRRVGRFKHRLGRNVLPRTNDAQLQACLAVIRDVRQAYGDEPNFKMGSWYYDIKANPTRHIDVIFCVAEILEQEQVAKGLQ